MAKTHRPSAYEVSDLMVSQFLALDSLTKTESYRDTIASRTERTCKGNEDACQPCWRGSPNTQGNSIASLDPQLIGDWELRVRGALPTSEAVLRQFSEYIEMVPRKTY